MQGKSLSLVETHQPASVFKRTTSHFFSAHPPNGLLVFFNPIGFGIGKIVSSFVLELSDKLKSFGFHESKAGTSIFVFKTKTTVVYILLYVDDILITGSSSDAIHTVIQSLQNKFAVRD